MNIDDTASTLETLDQRLHALGDSKQPPRTFFEVIDESRTESVWQHTLAYFLTPDETHGFGTTITETFLSVIEEHPASTFEFYEYNLEDIEVQLEAAGEVGRPDIVLWLDETWFLCIELKVDAAETDRQTERYTNATQFGKLRTTSIPESGHHFVYLGSRHASGPTADEFVSVTWREVVEAFAQHFEASLTIYPARSVAHFHDFVHHIQQELNMTDDQGPNPEKVELAFEYSDTISELTEATEEFIEEYQASWDRRFEQDPPDGWTDDWKTIRYGNKWGRLMKTDWMLPENLNNEPQKTSGFSIAISIDVTLDDFKQGETEAVVRVFGDNEYTEQYLERFSSDVFQDQIQSQVETTKLMIDNSNSPKIVRSVHPFEFDGGEGHLDALRDIFNEYNKIAPLLGELYNDIRSEIDNPEELFD